MELDDFQLQSSATDQRQHPLDEVNKLIPLLGLIGEVGSVAAVQKKRLRDKQSYTSFREKFKKELGDVLWYVATLARDADIKLSEVAAANLAWTSERWDDLKNFQPERLYDEDLEDGEKFPREITVEFKTVDTNKIVLLVNGVQIGDQLTDNAHDEDGYRFHDIFHFSFMAVIGWSPVLRKLLGKKRKSDPKIDEVEDGARAAILEEAIAAMAYMHAKEHKFYEDIEVIDFDILHTIKGMVRGLEVKNIPSSLWEKALVEGFRVYRELKKHNGGKVFINIDKRTIKFLC